MTKTYLALYKGRKSGRRPGDLAKRAADWLIRKATHSPYSHCEIAVDIGIDRYHCYSASGRDGGVRKKWMALPPEKWDLAELSGVDLAKLQALYQQTRQSGYDWLGVFGYPLGLNLQDRWFCSEWCAAALGLPNPHRYTPAGLAAYLKAV